MVAPFLINKRNKCINIRNLYVLALYCKEKIMSKLTAKEDLFAHKVVELDNQSEALRIAYPYTRKWKVDSVWNRASELAGKPEVKDRIEQIKNRLSKKEIITKERILNGLVERLDVDPIDYIEIKEGDDSKQVLYVKNLNELTKAQRQSIKSMKETRFGIELEFYSHVELVDRINKMVGFNEADKVDVNNTGSVDIKQLLKLSRND